MHLFSFSANQVPWLSCDALTVRWPSQERGQRRQLILVEAFAVFVPGVLMRPLKIARALPDRRRNGDLSLATIRAQHMRNMPTNLQDHMYVLPRYLSAARASIFRRCTGSCRRARRCRGSQRAAAESRCCSLHPDVAECGCSSPNEQSEPARCRGGYI